MQETQETQARSLVWEESLEDSIQPTPVFLSGKSYGQKNLAGYSPWDRIESGMAEQGSTQYILRTNLQNLQAITLARIEKTTPGWQGKELLNIKIINQKEENVYRSLSMQ